MKKITFTLLLLASIQSEQNNYHPTPDRSVDIHHSIIDIRIDFLSEKVIGKVEHTLAHLVHQYLL